MLENNLSHEANLATWPVVEIWWPHTWHLGGITLVCILDQPSATSPGHTQHHTHARANERYGGICKYTKLNLNERYGIKTYWIGRQHDQKFIIRSNNALAAWPKTYEGQSGPLLITYLFVNISKDWRHGLQQYNIARAHAASQARTHRWAIWRHGQWQVQGVFDEKYRCLGHPEFGCPPSIII